MEIINKYAKPIYGSSDFIVSTLHTWHAGSPCQVCKLLDKLDILIPSPARFS